MLETGQLAFRGTQFLVDNANTVVYKLGGFGSYFIFVVVGIFVIQGHQHVDKVDAAAWIAVLEVKSDNRSRFGSGFTTQTSCISGCYSGRRDYGSCDGTCLVYFSQYRVAVRRKGKDTYWCGQYTWKLIEVFMKGHFVSIPIRIIAGFHIHFSVGGTGHFQGHWAKEAVGFFGSGPYLHRRGFVQVSRIAEGLCLFIVDIEVQFVDDFLDKGAGTENLYFVVKVTGHTEHAQILHGLHGRGRRVFGLVTLFNQYGGIDIVHGGLITQIGIHDDAHYDDTAQNPGPIHQVFKKQCLVIYGLFIFRLEAVFVSFVTHNKRISSFD